MKKFICLILICLTLPITSLLLVGCGKDKYNIKDFYTSYTKIEQECNYLVSTEASDSYQLKTGGVKIDIDYSKSPQLETLVENSSTPYYNLKHFYQQLLDDTLSPMYFYGARVAESKKISEKQTEQLFKKLNALKQNYIDINYYVGMLANSLNATNNSQINLSYLNRVFAKYEQAIISAGNLSAEVCNAYFNKVFTTYNHDYSSKASSQLDAADLARLDFNTRTRMHYYKSVFANIYTQKYVRKGNLAQKLSSLPLASAPADTAYDYIKTLTLPAEQTNFEALLTNANTVSSIYDNAVTLYNIQQSFDKAYSNFVVATNKVCYLELTEISSSEEKSYGKIIDQFSNGIAIDSYEVIQNLFDLLY